ncbi:transposable element gene [Prunus dulcis]|uniref:Transposable element protein n=1 Tax=Prunus dulcis TaxID=3755 RepID=A0A5H2XXY7_PRUDU|nr:transposable element gene [Prunus dulcis]
MDKSSSQSALHLHLHQLKIKNHLTGVSTLYMGMHCMTYKFKGKGIGYDIRRNIGGVSIRRFFGSGDDANMLDGNKHHSGVPSSSGRRKRSRKATGDAILQNEGSGNHEERGRVFHKQMHKDTIAGMDDFDLELDEMELTAAAAGYYYYNSVTKQTCRSLSPSKESGFMTEVLNGDDDVFQEMFRMDKNVFHKLCDILRQRGMLRDTAGVMIEEQLGIFLNIIGHNERNRVIQERFHHSGETISRHFNNVLKAVKSLSREFLQTPTPTTPPKILGNIRFYPYFQDCVGVIGGMHIPAHVPAKDQSRFRNKKGVLSQNVLAACTFDLQFIFIYPGWEGSAAGSRVLKAVLDDPHQNFPCIPEGKYYLVDSGYANMKGFIAPFQGTRFPILKLAPQYAVHIQRDIVIAACVLHNYIRRMSEKDWLFFDAEKITMDELPDLDENPDMELVASLQEHVAFSLRESIAAEMWNDFINRWDQWIGKLVLWHWLE